MGKIESIEFAIELIEKEMNNAIDQDWLQKAEDALMTLRFMLY